MFNKTDPSYFDGPWTFDKTERAILGLCKILDRYAHKLTLEDLQNDPRCAKIPNVSLEVVQRVIADVETKLWRGVKPIENEVIYHTGPHHDQPTAGIAVESGAFCHHDLGLSQCYRCVLVGGTARHSRLSSTGPHSDGALP